MLLTFAANRAHSHPMQPSHQVYFTPPFTSCLSYKLEHPVNMAATSFIPGTVVQTETKEPLTRLTADELSEVRKQAVAIFKKLNPTVSSGKIVVKGFDDVPRSNTGT